MSVIGIEGTPEPLRIHRLEVRNYKKIKHAVITPDPNQHVLLLTGRNRQGKTSLIETIWVCLCGEKYLPPQPIREGETSAEASIDFGEFVVTRTITAKNTRLTVVAKDGFKAPSPQTFLTSKISGMIQNPLEFMRLKPDQQVKMLQGLVDLKIDQQEWEKRTGLPLKRVPEDPLELFDGAHKYLYEARAEENHNVNHLTGAVSELRKQLPADVDMNMSTVSAAELFGERKGLEAQASENARVRASMRVAADEVNQATSLVAASEETIRRYEDEIKRTEDLIKSERVRKEGLVRELKEANGRAQELVNAVASLEDPDFGPIDAKIASIDAHNALAAKVVDLGKLSAKLQAARSMSESFTRSLAALKEYKGDLIARAGLPIPGLSFDAGVVTYNGLPLSQASGAEQIRVSCAICMASHPSIGLLTLDAGWSELDAESKGILADWARNIGAHIVCVQVSEEPQEAGWHFEDGEITHKDGQPVPPPEPVVDAPKKRSKKNKDGNGGNGEVVESFGIPSWLDDTVDTGETPAPPLNADPVRPPRLVNNGGAE